MSDLKGLSPLLASVVLIGIVVTAGVMISTWSSHWIGDRTAEASSCITKTNYFIEEAVYDRSDKELTLHVTNFAVNEIYGFSVQIQNGSYIRTFNESQTNYFSMEPNVTSADPLGEQETAIIVISLYPSGGTDYTNLAETATQVRVLNQACPARSAENTNIIKEA